MDYTRMPSSGSSLPAGGLSIAGPGGDRGRAGESRVRSRDGVGGKAWRETTPARGDTTCGTSQLQRPWAAALSELEACYRHRRVTAVGELLPYLAFGANVRCQALSSQSPHLGSSGFRRAANA